VIDTTIRRLIAVEAHRRRTGRCPTMIHALGTGDTFSIRPLADGFLDEDTGCRLRVEPGGLMRPEGAAPVELRLTGDIAFEGLDHNSAERFTGRAGGGSSVTLYGAGAQDFSQFAVVGLRGEYLHDAPVEAAAPTGP
jgi:hypothetical protein